MAIAVPIPAAATKSPPFAKGGLGGLTPALCVENPHLLTTIARHRHSGAGRNPEPRFTPDAGYGRGVGSRFRGNDGNGSDGVFQRSRHRRPPGPSPLPAGEGWVREKRHILPIPPHRHSRESGNPPPPIACRRKPGFWIPACAGMTVGAFVGTAGDSCRIAPGRIPPTPLLRKGGYWWREWRTPPTVIPAKAGIHRRPSRTRRTPGIWIPACAGMTVGGVPRQCRGFRLFRAFGSGGGRLAFGLLP